MKYIISFFAGGILFLLVSCSQMMSSGDADIFVRIAVESEKKSDAVVRIFAEGADGNMLTGATVLVYDTLKQVSPVKFDTQEWCYKITLPVPSDGIFRISVSSAVSAAAKEYTVPHFQCKGAPVVTLIQDSEGKSVFAGEKPSSAKDIQICWNTDGVAGTVYKVAVKTALEAVYTVSCEQAQVVIPAGTLLPNQTYYAQVQAQRIAGDAFFKNAPYYSVSVYTGSNVGFSLE
ncbi:hypothetical protein [Treponema brennaborense]|uniref:Lipoprotein n=1 Tax=Treponema brennaborense (strain DSM 12168 / CIP 105900 / DD5/3) TaxID=906968 RepID=F4LJP0_TREBD|nr:hypothetical protein [Treponema brennaborense]AEE17420.1 hypothetical protein Trebr_2005 [Treponema brennaborense DSM 12168]